MKAKAAGNASDLAVTRWTYTLRPRDNAFITDAREKYLPNALVFSAWNVFSFQASGGSANPVLEEIGRLELVVHRRRDRQLHLSAVHIRCRLR